MRRSTAGVVGVGALAAAAAGCAEIEGGPTTVVSLAFDTSTVAVVVGDTLRDTLGAILPLRATPFNATGDTIREAAVPVSYVATLGDTVDTAPAVQISGALAIGLRVRATPTRVFALAGGLQSLPKSVDVIRRPTRLVAAPTAVADSVPYLAGNTAATLRSAQSAVTAPAQVRVSGDSAGTLVGVRRVAVRFAVVYAAPTIADSVFLVDDRGLGVDVTGALDRGRFSALDTTDAGGLAGRRVALLLRSGAAGRDSVVLRATIAYPGRIRGVSDTVRVVIPVLPATPAR